MVFVTVSDYDSPDFIAPFDDITEVGDNQVDAEHIFFGKHKSGINNDDIIIVFQHHHVLADFTQPTERNNP
jgi:hypothetical protein